MYKQQGYYDNKKAQTKLSANEFERRLSTLWRYQWKMQKSDLNTEAQQCIVHAGNNNGFVDTFETNWLWA